MNTRFMIPLMLAAGLAGCAEGVGVGSGGTFVVAVGNEQFRVRIDNAFMATSARRMMTGREDQKIVVGQLERGDGGFNQPYSWHIKPGTVTFAELSIELCDGRPSDIEADVAYWVDTVKQFCPWGGRFVSEVGR